MWCWYALTVLLLCLCTHYMFRKDLQDGNYFICCRCRTLQHTDNVAGYELDMEYCRTCTLGWCWMCNHYMPWVWGGYCDNCWTWYNTWYADREWYWRDRIEEETETKVDK